MIGSIALKNLLAVRHKGDVAAFGREVLHLAGVCDAHGNRYRNANGQRELRESRDGTGAAVPRIKLAEISLRGLADTVLGEEAVERWLKPDLVRDTLGRTGTRDVLETGTNMQMPSQFANINAFTAVAVGLLEAGILEGYQNPEFIADQLAPVEPTRQFEGRKSIGISRVGDEAEERIPGMPTKRVQLGERWVNQPRTVENALAIEVTQEAVYLDLTGQLTEEANDLGAWVGYRKELRVIDAFIGVNQSYNYKGNAYNTWIVGGYYDNDLAGNELMYPDAVKAAEIKFRDMKDPETNTRILMNPNTVLVQREYIDIAAALFGAPDLQYRTLPTAGATARQTMVNGPSVYRGRNYNVLESPLVYERINAATGLNQSASNAGKYWWLFDKAKFMRYAENWAMRTQTASPGQLDMIDRGVVLYVKADERGTPWIKEPRAAVRNRG